MTKKSTKPAICVFAGSNIPKDREIIIATEKLGISIAQSGYDLIYGDGKYGLMGIVAQSAKDAGANITSVTVKKYANSEQINGASIIVVEDETERFKTFMSLNPTANIMLPGGPGTARESFQAIEEIVYNGSKTPFILVKTGNYLDGIKQYLQTSISNGFIPEKHKDKFLEWGINDNIRDIINKGIV